jgi:hypothetical protein
VITDLLPPASDPDATHYDLDLHGASLEYLNLEDKVIGQLRIRVATLHESTSLRGLQVHGPAWFTGARCAGRFHAQGIVFHERSWFSKFSATGRVDFTGARFLGDTKFAGSTFGGPVSFKDVSFARGVDFSDTRFDDELDLRVTGGATARTHAMTVSLHHSVELPDGWTLDTSRGEEHGLVRA